MQPEVVNPLLDFDLDETITKKGAILSIPKEVHIHPLVLLSAVDHFVRINNRVSSGKRVAGILLGERTSRNVLDVNNSFAVPFEEDVHNPDVWFMDGNYIKEMFQMVRKVWSKTKIVGWYSTGPKICRNDLSIHEMIRTFCTNPVYCIIDVDPKEEGQPTASYACVETMETGRGSVSTVSTFTNLKTVQIAIEAEEIGVEQMLRDLTDSTVSTLSTRIQDRQSSLSTLQLKLNEIREYLDDVIAGKLPKNHDILYKVQKIFNVLPNVQQLCNSQGMIREVNDISMTTYIGSLIRCLLALDALITNKRQAQKKKDEREEERNRKKQQQQQQPQATPPAVSDDSKKAKNP